MGEPRTLVVFAPNWLGDAVMALPAIEDLRRHLGGRLVVAARASVAQLFALVPGVDETIELQWRGKVTSPAALLADVGRLRRVRGDVALLLPNSFASAVLAVGAGIPVRWGYRTDGRALLLTRAIATPQSSAPVHQGAYYQHLVRELGAASGPLEPRLALPDAALTRARTLLEQSGWQPGQPLVMLAPGAAYGTAKQWWPTHYARLAGELVRLHQAHIVLVGSRADAETTSEVRGMVPESVLPSVRDLAGQTDLVTLAAIAALAAACVSNDSGAMHVAAAVGVPLAAIFGPTNEHETAPLVHAPLELLIQPVSCRPCMLRECPIDHPCMRDLDPARVVESVTRLLRGGAVA